MAFLHGIQVTEPTTGARLILETLGAVTGLVAVAADADPLAFPLDKPVLVTDVQAAIGKAGVQGTLSKALGDIANQGSPIVVVVRVAEGADAAATDTAVIGTTASGSYTGLQALLAAEAQLGIRPRILGCPGLDSQNVATALAIVARKLRGFAYVACPGDDVADALLYREGFASRELMGIWPDFTGGPVGTWPGKAVAVALGMRALLDQTIGWHRSLSNVAVAGVTGLSHDVHFDLQNMTTPAGLLNAAHVTTLVHQQGHRFWGNRTFSDDPKFAFEVAVRTSQAIQDAIAEGLLWAVDQPLTRGLLTDITETVNATLRRWTTEGRLVGGRCWFDPASNPPGQLAGGRLVLDYDFTPCAPLEGLQLNQRITDRYYQGFGDDPVA